jgi:hypothetical protein
VGLGGETSGMGLGNRKMPRDGGWCGARAVCVIVLHICEGGRQESYV